jgi:hypothetical protein
MPTTDLWTYRDTAWSGTALAGMDVEATDGGIGKIETATDEYIVVDTGPWIFGKKVMLPAGVIDRVDLDDETVCVDLTKDAIKNAPEYDESQLASGSYRSELATYYGDRF